MPKITPAKVHQLSDQEIDAVAAALQMSGKRGVTITIESLRDDSQGYQVVIMNRVEKTATTGIAKSAASPNLADQLAIRESTPAAETLDWDNVLERRQTNKIQSSALSVAELPVWAQ